MAAFPLTRHSVIERLRAAGDEERRDAFGELVTGYWKPVYKHLRLTWGVADEDARDLTQAFFSDAFQKEWLARYDPSQARFRTFVRMCADRFVLKWKQSASRQKRGGGVETVSLDFEGAQRELRLLDLATPAEADGFFRQEFVRALFERAVASVREEYAGRDLHLAVFDRYDLDPVDGVSYSAIAAELGVTTAQVTNYLAQVRRSFRQHALVALEGLTGSRDEYRREARELFGVEVE
jgi:DNA-directed RNA polymerase specialized sigma24 family protein